MKDDLMNCHRSRLRRDRDPSGSCSLHPPDLTEGYQTTLRHQGNGSRRFLRGLFLVLEGHAEKCQLATLAPPEEVQEVSSE